MSKNMTPITRDGLGGPKPGHWCVHLESGRTRIPKFCIQGQECWHCAFEQWIEEMGERSEIEGHGQKEKVLMARAA